MTQSRRVNTSVTPASVTPPLVRAALLVLAAFPMGWFAAVLTRREANGGEAPATPMVVAVVVAAFVWVAARGPADWPLLVASLALAWSLVCLAAVDIMAYRLPDALTLPLLAGGLVVALLLPGRPLPGHLAGAVAGWGSLAALAWIYRRLRGVDGMGLGDAKLFGAAGAWLGWAALPSAMLVACAAAFAWIGLTRLRRGRPGQHERIAFGAPLSFAILAVWLEGPLVL